MKAKQMTNKELRLAIEDTVRRLAPDRGPFVTPQRMPDDVKERLVAHLDTLLAVEAGRASAFEIEKAGGKQ